MIAALYVHRGGPYYGLPGVDPWDEARDARRYAGPHPVVAHPPCERWGRYWFGGPSAKARRTLGDDGGCFAAALASVRAFGGVLEHPAHTHAWAAFGLPRPSRYGGWTESDAHGGRACHVEQGHYGHRARKATWLYAVSQAPLPELTWGPSPARARLDAGYHSAEERRLRPRVMTERRLTAAENRATPPAFRDVLVAIAKSSRARE